MFISKVERKCPYYKKKIKKITTTTTKKKTTGRNVCVGGNYELNYEL